MSAVLSAEQIDPWNFASRRGRLIRNPWATAVLGPISLGVDEFDPIDLQFLVPLRNGERYRQLVGLLHEVSVSMAFDELLFHHRLARPGTIIEAGANKGDYTLHFAVWERQKVVAFEPFAPIFEILTRRLSGGFEGSIPSRVRLVQAALGDRIGEAVMRVPKIDGGLIDEWSSLVKSFEGMEGVEYDECRVPVWTIDALDIADVTNLKIDVEGGEIEVLRGARRTIQRCRPVISVECEERHRTGTSWWVPGFMEALDYDGLWYDYHNGDFRRIDELDRTTMQIAGTSPRDRHYSDPYIFVFFYIPREDHELHLRLAEFGPLPAR